MARAVSMVRTPWKSRASKSFIGILFPLGASRWGSYKAVQGGMSGLRSTTSPASLRPRSNSTADSLVHGLFWNESAKKAIPRLGSPAPNPTAIGMACSTKLSVTKVFKYGCFRNVPFYLGHPVAFKASAVKYSVNLLMTPPTNFRLCPPA